MYYKNNFNNYKSKECAFCGEPSGKYELCSECYNMAKEEIIIKNDKGLYIKNVKKGNEYKFFDPNKTYTLKTDLLNEWEMRFFNIVRTTLKSKYVIVPQVNLQTIIETNTHTRNDELFRNIDFVVYYAKQYIPFLAIELNGQQHYTNEYWKERDKSVKSILDMAQLPILTIDIKDIKQMEDKQLNTLMKKVIKYLNPSFIKKLLGKKPNKMNLSWTNEIIKAYTNNIK